MGCNRLNLTLLDSDNIQYYRSIKDRHRWSWDEVFRRHRFSDLRETRAELLDLEMQNFLSWLDIAYPERPDLSELFQVFFQLARNDRITRSPDVVNLGSVKIQALHGDLLKVANMDAEQQKRAQDERSRLHRDPRLPRNKTP